MNVTNITKYHNVNVNNAVVGINRDQFGRGRGQYQHLTAAQAQRLQPVHGPLGVKRPGRVRHAQHRARPPGVRVIRVPRSSPSGSSGRVQC